MNEISQKRENYLIELENTNAERRIELQARMNELQQREQELKELKLQLEIFGNLIDDQAIYLKSLQRKLKFWRVFSGILGTSLITTVVVLGVSK